MDKGELIIIRNTLDWCKAMVEAFQEDTKLKFPDPKMLRDINKSLGTIERELTKPPA